MSAKIEHKIIGDSNFLKAVEYSFELGNFIKEFEDRFLLAENITIHFEESINPNPNGPVRHLPVVTDDGKSIELTYRSSRFFMPNGSISKPSELDFFDGLRFYLENTVVVGDNERYKKIKY